MSSGMWIKEKYLQGKQYKNITRKKGDDQPGKAIRAANGKIHIVPDKRVKRVGKKKRAVKK